MRAFFCAENDDARRLDRVLRKAFSALPLSFLHRLLREKRVCVNGAAQNGAFRVSKGDEITLRGVDDAMLANVDEKNAAPRNTSKLRIVYEDGDFLVVEKAHGILTHGDASLAAQASLYLRERVTASLSFTPAPLHRLDRNTAGLVVFGKSIFGARSFTADTKAGRVQKFYISLLDGCLREAALWRDFLRRDKTARVTEKADSGRSAVTKITPLLYYSGKTLAMAEISSGFTHQIRAQCALHSHPLSGDAKYGGSSSKKNAPYFLLAHKICAPRFSASLARERILELVSYTRWNPPALDNLRL